MTRYLNYMSGIETYMYLYNGILHNNNKAFVRNHSDEIDTLNQSGILNLFKRSVAFTRDTKK